MFAPPNFIASQRDLIIYALGLGCTELDFVYENSDSFAAFPTYPIVLGDDEFACKSVIIFSDCLFSLLSPAFKGTALDVVSFPSPVMGCLFAFLGVNIVFIMFVPVLFAADTNVTPPLPGTLFQFFFLAMDSHLSKLEGTKTGLDGERYIQILAPLPADGASLLFKQRLVSCRVFTSLASLFLLSGEYS